MADEDTVTVAISTDDATEEIEVSTGLIDVLREGDESAPAVVGDVAMLGFAQQIHGAVHHGRGEPSEELQAAEEVTMELFEERFGQSYAEMTGHDH